MAESAASQSPNERRSQIAISCGSLRAARNSRLGLSCAGKPSSSTQEIGDARGGRCDADFGGVGQELGPLIGDWFILAQPDATTDQLTHEHEARARADRVRSGVQNENIALGASFCDELELQPRFSRAPYRIRLNLGLRGRLAG